MLLTKPSTIVVICFQFSIFEPLDTTNYHLHIVNQQFTKKFRKEKRELFPSKNPASMRDFYFKTVLIAVLVNSHFGFSSHKKALCPQIVYP